MPKNRRALLGIASAVTVLAAAIWLVVTLVAPSTQRNDTIASISSAEPGATIMFGEHNGRVIEWKVD